MDSNIRYYILLTIILMSGIWVHAQVRLTQIEKSDSLHYIPVANRPIPGMPGYALRYQSLAQLLDSLALSYVTSVGLTTGTSGTDVNITGSPITSSGNITLNIPTASASNRGALSASDWTTFNNKIGSLNGLTGATQTFAKSITGVDFTISSSGSTHTFNLPYIGTTTSMVLGVGNTSPAINSVLIGQGTGLNLTGSNNVGLGFQSIRGGSGSTGTNNTALGTQAMYSLTSGTNNFAAGSYALYNLTSGSNNFGLGEQSLYNVTTGSGNTAIGGRSGQSNNQTENVHIGYYSARLASGSYNTNIGSLSGEQSSGNENTRIGYAAGRFSSGNNSVMIGEFAGNTNTTSSSLWIENSTTSTPLIGGRFDLDRVGINNSVTDITRTFDVNGEVRIRDLVTTTPTRLVSTDADGVLSSLGLSGLSISGGNLVTNNNGTVTSIATTNGITGGTITGSGTIQLTGQASALHNLASNGLIARTGTGTVAARTLTAGSGISITNGDGVSGNPVITATGGLPAGISSNMLTYISGSWQKTNFLKVNSTTTTAGTLKRVDINNDSNSENGGGGMTWPSSTYTDTKLLVNGKIQTNSTSTENASTLMGRSASDEVGYVTIGPNLSLTSNVLDYTNQIATLAVSNGTLTGVSTTWTKFPLFVTGTAQNGTSMTANDPNDRIIFNQSGTYKFGYKCNCAVDTAPITILFSIGHNGTAGFQTNRGYYASTSAYNTFSNEWVQPKSNGDYIELFVRTIAGTTQINQCEIFFYSERIK
jgi:hypothetical protein